MVGTPFGSASANRGAASPQSTSFLIAMDVSPLTSSSRGSSALDRPGTGPRDESHESELIGRAEPIAEKIRRYQEADLQYLALDPTQHSSSAKALEAIE